MGAASADSGFLLTWTSELLRFTSSVICNQKCSVVCDEGGLELQLGVFVDVFLVVGDQALGNSLPDGVDLGSVTTTGDANSDVDLGELIEADDEERLVNLLIVFFFFFKLAMKSCVD